jgi:hypothetical protein
MHSGQSVSRKTCIPSSVNFLYCPKVNTGGIAIVPFVDKRLSGIGLREFGGMKEQGMIAAAPESSDV